MKHFLRITALLLAVLLVALPPLQASAAAISGTAVMIGLGAAAVIGSVLVGLGVMPGQDRSHFDAVVDGLTELPTVSKYISNGLINVFRYKNSNGLIRYGVLSNLIESIHSALFAHEVIENKFVVPDIAGKQNSNWGMYYSLASGSKHAVYLEYSSGHFAFCYSSQPFTITASNYLRLVSGDTYTFWSSNSSGTWNHTSDNLSNLVRYEFFGYEDTCTSFSTQYDLHLGDIAAQLDGSAYANWSAGSIALPHPGIDIPGVDEGTDEGTGEDTGEEEGEEEGEQDKEKKLVYWPTGILNPATDTTDVLTQENVIAGNGTLDDTLTGELTGPIVGGITGDITLEDTPSIPGEGEDVGTGEGEGTGDIVYPTDIPTYTLDLREFFPFCLPFDIYEFLSILAADPVAPVFEWSIPVPQLGETFDLEVDLSAWDNVARLFRNLELLAFIVGLAMVTRDKFIRS